MFGIKGYRVGLREDNGQIEEIVTYWEKSKSEALERAKEKAKELGHQVERVTVREITDTQELISALWEEIDYLKQELEERTPSEHIGSVLVDSGQLIITDPCHLEEWEHGDYCPGAENSYAEACNASLSDEGYGEVLGGSAIVFSSGYGDGMYPVYAKRDEDGRIVRVEIDMTLE
jgi:hypothetical protein